ncbi:DNA gyrase inhibitor YacG [Hydrogenophaga sp. A37]|uniref:DNA gyrase inhibitor YacG n=1 Tax=Hydrogenophaga sp. A37 TaxID=1945864 RepID=UPI000986AF1E|nr:DNA gyrase inhibitor YacG [Hydrogenophaga sp. A37]OOG87883.1 DNA gyrase inhibitor YacG [Hydrogenophaga sp. A37]
MSSPDVPLKQVRCPACGGQSIYAPSNPYRPFCGERCKNLDLGAWASERFSLPEQEASSDPGFESS